MRFEFLLFINYKVLLLAGCMLYTPIQRHKSCPSCITATAGTEIGRDLI